MTDEFKSTLATELLSEVKESAKRWFVVAMAELIVIAILIFIMLFVPVEEYTAEQSADNGGYNQIIGGDYGGKTEGDLQEETRGW